MFDRLNRMLHKLASNLADFGAWLVSPIERFFAWLTKSTLRASERVERVESVFVGLWGLVTWPIRLLRRLLPEWLADVALAPFRLLGRALGSVGFAILRLAEWLNLDIVVDWLVWLTQPVWRPIGALGGFFSAWANTRQWRGMLWGIPAALVLIPALALAAHTMMVGHGGLIGPYKLAVKEALEEKDYARAELFERKLSQLGEDTELTGFRTALAVAEEGELDEAYERMQNIAPLDEPGYPAAHFWIAQQLLAGQLVEDPPERLRLIKAHLDQLAALEISGPQIDYMRAIWLVQNEKLEEATQMLEPLVSLFPKAAFQRMRLNLRLKRKGAAREDARRLSTQMAELDRQKNQLAGSDYQLWLAAEEVLGNTQQMEKVLDAWRKVEPDNQLAQQAQVVVAHRQAAQMMRSALPDTKKIADLLLDASELEGDLSNLKKMVSELSHNRDRAPVYAQLLEAFAASPRTPTEVVNMLATEAAVQGRYEEARRFFANSTERDPTDPVAWNNYGLVLAEGAEPELKQGLAAVNRALEMVPEEYRFRETRGQILLKLERWEGAIVDLEYALNGLPELTTIHGSLAKAYEALGKHELADLHRQQAE